VHWGGGVLLVHARLLDGCLTLPGSGPPLGIGWRCVARGDGHADADANGYVAASASAEGGGAAEDGALDCGGEGGAAGSEGERKARRSLERRRSSRKLSSDGLGALVLSFDIAEREDEKEAEEARFKAQEQEERAEANGGESDSEEEEDEPYKYHEEGKVRERAERGCCGALPLRFLFGPRARMCASTPNCSCPALLSTGRLTLAPSPCVPSALPL
jgi:hypothetical protein